MNELPRNYRGKVRIYNLTNEQLAALSEDVGYPKERWKRLDIEHCRATIVAMLQELENKGLLDCSVIENP